MTEISASGPTAAAREFTPARIRTLDAAELDQVAAAGSKPGGAGDGRGLLCHPGEAIKLSA